MRAIASFAANEIGRWRMISRSEATTRRPTRRKRGDEPADDGRPVERHHWANVGQIEGDSDQTGEDDHTVKEGARRGSPGAEPFLQPNVSANA